MTQDEPKVLMKRGRGLPVRVAHPDWTAAPVGSTLVLLPPGRELGPGSGELERDVARLQDQVRELQVQLRDHELRFRSIQERLGWGEDWERVAGRPSRGAP